MINRRTILLVGSALGFLTANADAEAPVHRIRGDVETVVGNDLTVHSRENKTVHISLASPVGVLQVVPTSIASIAPNSYVGIASIGPDDKMVAVEVLVFPEAARGAGEGHYAWDLLPDSMMTNATVGDVAVQADGRVLTLKLKGKLLKVTVPPNVPVVTFQPSDTTILIPGAKVFIPAQVAADGSMTAERVLVGKDGMTPPM